MPHQREQTGLSFALAEWAVGVKAEHVGAGFKRGI
jgi:hypothetical protein